MNDPYLQITTNTRVYDLSSSPLIIRDFLAVTQVGKKRKISSRFLLWIEHTSEYSVQTADENKKVTSQPF